MSTKTIFTVFIKYSQSTLTHPLMDDEKTYHSKVIETENLTSLNGKYGNIIDIKILSTKMIKTVSPNDL